MKLVFIAGAIVLMVCAGLAALKWQYPCAIQFIVEPLTENGPSLFQIFQSVALVGGAVATLWLTYKRTEALSIQANTTNSQLQHAFAKDFQDRFKNALELLSGPNSSEMGRVGGAILLRELAKEADEEHRRTSVNILAKLIMSETSEKAQKSINALSDKDGTIIRAAEPWVELDNNGVDIHEAWTSLVAIRKTCNTIPSVEMVSIAMCRQDFNGVNFQEFHLGGVFQNSSFTECDFSGLTTDCLLLKNCNFSKCDFSDAKFDAFSFEGCSFVECKVDNATLRLGGNWKIENNHHAEESPLTSSPLVSNVKRNPPLFYGTEAPPQFIVRDEHHPSS